MKKIIPQKKYFFSSSKNFKEYPGKILSFFLILILALFFWSSAALQNLLLQSTEMIHSFLGGNALLGAVIFILLAALSAILSPFSSLPLVPAAILIFGSTPTALMLLFGWSIGSIFAYLIGALAGEKVLRRIFSFEKIDYYKKRFSQKTQFLLVFLFRLSAPAEITAYTLGIIRYDFKKYLAAMFLSEIPFAFLGVYAGDALIAKNPLAFILLLAIGTAIVAVSFHFFRQEIRREKK